MEQDQLHCPKCGEPYEPNGEKEFVYCTNCGNKNPANAQILYSEPNPHAELMNAAKSKQFLWANVSSTAGLINGLILPVIMTRLIIRVIIFFSTFSRWISLAAKILSVLKSFLGGIDIAAKVIGYAEDALNIGRFTTAYGPLLMLVFIWLPVLVETAALVGSWMLYFSAKKNKKRLAAVSVRILFITTTVSFAGVVSVPAILFVSAFASADLLLGLIIFLGLFSAAASFLFISCIIGLNRLCRLLKDEDGVKLRFRCFKISLFLLGVFSVLSFRLLFGIYCFIVCSIIEKFAKPFDKKSKG